MKKSYFLFFLVILSIGLISPSVATSVVYQNGSLVVTGVPDDGIGLGAFDIVLLYPEDVQVSGVTLTPPFNGAVNDQHEGIVILAGFQVSDVLTRDVPVASLTVTGDANSLDIRVRSLINQRLDEIPRTNADYTESLVPVDEGLEDSSGIQTPTPSGETATQTSETTSPGISPVQNDGVSETVVATDSGLVSPAPSEDATPTKTDILSSNAPNIATDTPPQKSPLSYLGIFISIGAVVFMCRISYLLKK